ncbi:30S ribosomal protein S17 [Candidatus Kaiserbacteria bacterium]|nr:MAG: 30S ribosomal protein S17 [Candidatus Kaiserbacteria bacterium]
MEENTHKGKTLRGTVVGTSMEKTAKVAVSRYVKHPKYKKFVKQVKKYLVHDPENTAVIGASVVIRESRPISKNKNFVIES